MIEFNCSQCRTLLRIPDDASGKNIRCPQCNHIQTASPPPPPSRDIIAPSNPETRPFLPPSIQDTGNPYQSPRYDSTEKPEYVQPGGDLVHSKVGFTDVLTGFWNTFSNKIGPCAVTGVVSGLIMAFFSIFLVIIIYGGMAVIAISAVQGGPNAPPRFDPAIIVVFVVFYILAIFAINLASVYILLGATRSMLDVARGGEGKLGLLFVELSLFIRGIVLAIFTSMISLGALLLTAGPFGLVAVIVIALNAGQGQLSDLQGIIVFLSMSIAGCVAVFVSVYVNVRISMAFAFLVDRNCSAIEAIKQSFSFTKGNSISIFLILLCFWIVYVLISQMTMGIAALVFGMPAFALICVVIYLLATGQKMAFPPDGSGAAVANDDNYFDPQRA